jgi:hypothetical protein
MKHIFLLIVAAVALSASPLTDTNFIQQVYLDVLDRPVDPTALASGLGFLGSNSRQMYALTVVLHSDEYRNDLVSSYYQSYLSHTPTSGEAVSGLSFLSSGGADQELQATLLGSPEYFADRGNDNLAFVQSLYSKLLNRSGTFFEVVPLVSLLTSASATRMQVAKTDLLSTTEYEQDLLNSYLQQYLHRGFSSFDTFLLLQLEAPVPNELVQSEILGSQAYYELAQQEQTPEPAAWAFTITGLIALFLRRKRRF